MQLPFNCGMSVSRPAAAIDVAQAQPASRVPMEERWSYRISTLAGLLDKLSARRFAKHGLNLVQWRLLTSIASLGPCSMSELLPMAAVDRALVSREVAALTNRGFLAISGDSKDKRRKIVTITAAGVAKHDTIIPEVIARHAYLDDALTAKERLVFARAIEKMKARIIENLESGGR